MKWLHLYNVLGARTERWALEYPLELARRGHELALGYERRAEECPPLTLRQVMMERIAVEPTEDVAEQMERVAERAAAGLRDERWDGVHGHFGPRVLQAAGWLVRGTPVVLSLYGYDASRLLRDRSWAGRYRWAAERGAVFVVLCEAMRRRVVAAGVPGEAVRVIHLGVDASRWAFEPGEAGGAARFLFVGRMTEKKDPVRAVEALAAVRAGGVKARLTMAGDGPLTPAVRDAVERLGLGGCVELVGEVERERVAELMRGATALVLPSCEASDGDCEGTPVVLMEAQARGVVCITTEHGGNAEVIAPESRAFVVAERDTAGLARGMAAAAGLSAAERRAVQQAGRAWIERAFSLTRTAEEYEALYLDLR